MAQPKGTLRDGLECLLLGAERTYRRHGLTSDSSQEQKSLLPQEVEHWFLTTLREKLVKIGAKVVRHGRYVTFQLAEIAIPRRLFAEILRLIDGLRPKPAPT